jgi:hypothetical protein
MRSIGSNCAKYRKQQHCAAKVRLTWSGMALPADCASIMSTALLQCDLGEIWHRSRVLASDMT